VNGYLRLQLTCPLLSACCCWRSYLCSFCGELNTHLDPQALFTQNSPVPEPLLQAFPFPSTLGEVTLHLLSQACVFVYSSRGKWVFPSSCGVFLPPPLSQGFPLLLAGHSLLLPPSPAKPSLFIYSCIRDCSFPPFGAQGTLPSLLLVFFFFSTCSFIIQFVFFPGWGSVCPRALLIWPTVVCGSTMCHLAHLVVCFSQAG
jgi:hypothetical protein